MQVKRQKKYELLKKIRVMLDKAIAITDEIAKRTDEVILFHSASGKDSIALLDICAPRFKRVV